MYNNNNYNMLVFEQPLNKVSTRKYLNMLLIGTLGLFYFS